VVVADSTALAPVAHGRITGYPQPCAQQRPRTLS
jgi:hypothetical protein